MKYQKLDRRQQSLAVTSSIFYSTFLSSSLSWKFHLSYWISPILQKRDGRCDETCRGLLAEPQSEPHVLTHLRKMRSFHCPATSSLCLLLAPPVSILGRLSFLPFITAGDGRYEDRRTALRSPNSSPLTGGLLSYRVSIRRQGIVCFTRTYLPFTTQVFVSHGCVVLIRWMIER